jgi:hypothetical protein
LKQTAVPFSQGLSPRCWTRRLSNHNTHNYKTINPNFVEWPWTLCLSHSRQVTSEWVRSTRLVKSRCKWWSAGTLKPRNKKAWSVRVLLEQWGRRMKSNKKKLGKKKR